MQASPERGWKVVIIVQRSAKCNRPKPRPRQPPVRPKGGRKVYVFAGWSSEKRRLGAFNIERLRRMIHSLLDPPLTFSHTAFYQIQGLSKPYYLVHPQEAPESYCTDKKRAQDTLLLMKILLDDKKTRKLIRSVVSFMKE